jgi:hypothetical protein
MSYLICTKCGEEKAADEFYVKTNGNWHTWCKTCFNKATGQRVSERRRLLKETLVEEFGSICLDCGNKYPPFMMDFDHRDPSEKSFTIAASTVLGIDRLREEAKKCDLVCANCHRMRTHKQRCNGCAYCLGE